MNATEGSRAEAVAVGANSPHELALIALTAVSRELRSEALTVRTSSRIGELGLSDVRSLCAATVLQGAMRVVLEGEEHLVSAGEYVTMDARALPRGWVTEGSPTAPFVAVTVALDGVEICKVAELLELKPGAAHRSAATLSPELTGALARLVRAASSPRDRAVLVPIYRNELLYRLMRAQHSHRLIELARCRQTDEPLQGVLQYIDDHLAEAIVVADLAAVARLSVSALSSQFTATIGRSPYQYVKDRRLERSLELLQDRKNDVARVARMIGYSSPSHFISQFRVRFGMTPRIYAMRDRASRHV